MSVPTVFRLTRGQRDGSRCVWCGLNLDDTAIPAGVAAGYWGAHDLSVRVYACPTHPHGLTETGDAS